MKIDIALLGGVGFTTFDDGDILDINTEYGEVRTYLIKEKGKYIALIPRHSNSKEHLPPHMINYHANIRAIKEMGIKRVISTNSVGSMKGHPIGSFVIIDDFIDFTKNRKYTYYDDKTIHVDMTEPFCPQIRKALQTSLDAKGLDYSQGTYACTEGPRFETKAEIRMLANFSDVVGMTLIPEVILAKEMELCYASVCTVTNLACGMGESALTASEVVTALCNNGTMLRDILLDAIEFLPQKRDCNCMNATIDAGL